MSLIPLNIADFDQIGTIKSPSYTDANGERNVVYSDLYTNVYLKEVKPSSSSDEKNEEGQVVAINKRAFVLRKQDRVLRETYICVIDNDNYHINSIHRYGNDRQHLVIECESRDND